MRALYDGPNRHVILRGPSANSLNSLAVSAFTRKTGYSLTIETDSVSVKSMTGGLHVEGISSHIENGQELSSVSIPEDKPRVSSWMIQAADLKSMFGFISTTPPLAASSPTLVPEELNQVDSTHIIFQAQENDEKSESSKSVPLFAIHDEF